MRKKKLNIDEIVKSSLHDFEENAPDGAWEVIADRIDNKRARRLPVFIYWAAAVAFILGFSFVLKMQFVDNDGVQIAENENVVQSSEIKILENNKIFTENKKVTIENKKANNKTTIEEVRTEEISEAEKQNQNNTTIINIDEPIISQTNSDSKTQKTANSEIQKKEKIFLEIESQGQKKIPVEVQSQPKEKVVSELEKETEQQILLIPDNQKKIENTQPKFKETKKQSKWSVGGGVSPVYSFRNVNYKADNVSYDWVGGQNNEKNEVPVVAFSGGIDVEYSRNRWSFSSGLYYSQTGQETENFNFNRMVVYSAETNIYASTSAGNITYQQTSDLEVSVFNTPETDNHYPPNAIETEPVESDARLKQDFEYLEIPFITKYKIIDRKIDVQVLAGVSTNFLIGNSNILSYTGNELDMGKVKNIRSINYNSIVGLGFQYPVSKFLKFRLQPVFKYSLLPINEEYSVQNFPYSFAVYTGVAFDF